MTTPFDEVVEEIKRRGYHNHRLDDHSDTVSLGILRDLTKRCRPLRADLASERIRHWVNVKTPGARQRKIDLLVGEAKPDGKPDLDKLRICVENKSVITAHRNRDARFDDLNESLQVLHRVKSEAVLVATVIVGVARRVLNVPDKVKPIYKNKPGEFETNVMPRLSRGDARLWQEFDWAVSNNRLDDAEKTVKRFQQLQKRSPGHTHVVGYDYLLLVPIHIDNVNPPYIPRPNVLGISVESEYKAMLSQICKAYSARWHL